MSIKIKICVKLNRNKIPNCMGTLYIYLTIHGSYEQLNVSCEIPNSKLTIRKPIMLYIIDFYIRAGS